MLVFHYVCRKASDLIFTNVSYLANAVISSYNFHCSGGSSDVLLVNSFSCGKSSDAKYRLFEIHWIQKICSRMLSLFHSFFPMLYFETKRDALETCCHYGWCLIYKHIKSQKPLSIDQPALSLHSEISYLQRYLTSSILWRKLSQFATE